MKKKQVLAIVAASAALFTAGCSSSNQTATTAAAPPAAPAPAIVKGVGLDMANLDSTVSPCEDFYEFANGGWLKNNPIPASESAWGSFNELADKNNAMLRSILEAAAANTSAAKGTPAQKVGDFYASGMDSAAIEQAGLSPLREELAQIAALKTARDVQKLVARHKMLGIGSMFRVFVDQDSKNSTQYALYAYQGGLGLPDRDYYLKDDKRSQQIRAEYLKHLQNMFVLLGDDAKKASQKAKKVLELETRMAKASMTRVQLRDLYATYNKMNQTQLKQMAPNLDWNLLLSSMNASAAKDVIVGQPEFFKELSQMMKAVPVADWKTYLQWHLIHAAAPYLSQNVVQENFKFYGTVLSGTQEMQPRWKRVLRTTDDALGEALGQLYVAKAFSPEAKKKALEMVKNLQLAFQEHVQNLDWMSNETKKQAQAKLDAFVTKIGYPDKWKTYETLEINRGPYVLNILRSNQYSFNEEMAKLGKPIDHTEWFMSPPTVNAYYNPSMNEIVFPAGILQPPFFDPKADDAVNYGGMGAVIGHELTHGFDDQGRQFDLHGNLKDWWTAEDGDKFMQRAEMVARQFDKYEPLDSVFVNGQLTLGENIADLGGLNIAYTALQKALKEKHPGKLDGLTPEQRFFLAWAQIWRINARDEYLQQQVLVDPHSPGKFRVNGPLSNMPQFYEAFNCKPNDKMVRPEAERAKIW